jgi:hypothetical protein
MGSIERFLCNRSESSGLERLRYFPRQLLTADDMRAEQEYFREKQRRHNRLLHGWGVVCGLEVVLDAEAGPLAVCVCPGYALGPFGDEIYVPEAVKLDLTYCANPKDQCKPRHSISESAGTTVSHPADRSISHRATTYMSQPPSGPILVMICYAECPTRPMRTLPAGCGCDETACEYSRIRDGFEIQCALKPKHDDKATNVQYTICEIEKDIRHKLPKCPPCPTDPWVVLATVSPVIKPDGSATLKAESINNATRRIIYSTASIQRQLIEHCPKD